MKVLSVDLFCLQKNACGLFAAALFFYFDKSSSKTTFLIWSCFYDGRCNNRATIIFVKNRIKIFELKI